MHLMVMKNIGFQTNYQRIFYTQVEKKISHFNPLRLTEYLSSQMVERNEASTGFHNTRDNVYNRWRRNFFDIW